MQNLHSARNANSQWLYIRNYAHSQECKQHCSNSEVKSVKPELTANVK